MTEDLYSALGLCPTSEDVVIRAAYLALIRRYHPDSNPSDEAAARTRTITAAYAVLGDPAKRSEYDETRAEEAWALGPGRRPPSTASRALFPAAAAMLALVLVLLVVWSPLPLAGPPAPRAHAPARAAAVREHPAPTASPPLPKPSPQLPVKAPSIETPEAAVEPADREPVIARSKHLPKPAVQPKVTPPKPVATTTRNLANLDRLQALQYRQSLRLADASKRALLVTSSKTFSARRDACRSEACARGAYLARMQEITAIMTSR